MSRHDDVDVDVDVDDGNKLLFNLSPRKKVLLNIFESLDQVLAIYKSQSGRCPYVVRRRRREKNKKRLTYVLIYVSLSLFLFSSYIDIESSSRI